MADFNDRFGPSPLEQIAAALSNGASSRWDQAKWIAGGGQSGWGGQQSNGPMPPMYTGGMTYPLQAQGLEAYAAQQRAPTQQQSEIYSRNEPYVQQGAANFNTQLPPLLESQFRDWIGKNNVPFDPNQHIQDYDMRGFWQGLVNGHPKAVSAVNQNDGKMHYPDYWKTPYHESFSGESQWAGPNAPKWNDKDQLVAPDGRVIYDERKRK